MPDGPSPPPDGGLEQAGAEHWRRVAEERTAALEELSRRPLVRAVVGIERRAAPLVGRARRGAAGAATAARRASLAAGALVERPEAARSLRALEDRLAALGPPPADPEGVVVTVSGAGAAAVAAADRAIRGAATPVVVLVPVGVEVRPGAVARLVDAVAGDVLAAVPTVAHARRPVARATPDDGRTWSAGLALTCRDGVPVARARGAGEPVDPAGPPEPVPAGVAAGLALDRAAYVAAGGFAPLGDLDAAAVELLVRLGSLDGRALVHVPGAVVVDGRPVGSRSALLEPIDPTSTAWLGVVDRAGSALANVARGGPSTRTFALTIAAPSWKVARRWGDLHLAEGLAGELGRLGHEALVQTYDQADDAVGRACDVHIVVRGLRAVRRTPGQAHVLWIISHPEAVRDHELDEADLVVVASERLATVLAARTATPVRVLLQATDHRRFRPGPVDPAHRHDVVIVAKSREVPRPMVLAAVEAGLVPAIYGGGWDRFVDPSLVVADHIDNEDLPAVYRSAGVVLNDHWDTMRTAGFVSNRIFDVLACSTPVISDHLPEIADLLGDAVPTWTDPSELAELVRADLSEPAAARARAARGRERVLAAHTFEHRAQELLAMLAELGIGRVGR